MMACTVSAVSSSCESATLRSAAPAQCSSFDAFAHAFLVTYNRARLRAEFTQIVLVFCVVFALLTPQLPALAFGTERSSGAVHTFIVTKLSSTHLSARAVGLLPTSAV